MPSILIKSLKPRSMNIKGYRNTILDQLRQEGRQIRILFDKTTRTWDRKVRFRTDVRVSGNVAEVKVSTKDTRFIAIDKGTKIRWAVMSSDFKAKSQVRVIGSRRGSGKPVIRGRRAMMARNIRPRPGIKARNFSIEIRKRRRPIFFNNMRRAMKRAAKNTF